ncbi:MAG: DUF2062 domain-containing protein [Desulfobacterales bacterium]|nr:DUF2062 domain-containing protein [Desulfobacterales bacterium]
MEPQTSEEQPVGRPGLASLQKTYTRFLKIRGTPREIALGFALGLFIGMSPTMGFQMAIAVFFAALLKWNKISAAVAVWVTNPFTAPIIYGLTYFVGAKMIGMSNNFKGLSAFDLSGLLHLIQKTPEILLAMTLGGVVVGLPLAVAGYYFSFSAVNTYQKDIKTKLAERRERRASGKNLKKLRKKRKKRH